VMRHPGLWYMRYWMGYRSSRSKMLELIDELEPELIVGDEEFSCLSLALEKKVRNVMVSDELELGFARSSLSRYIERRVSRWYDVLQRDVSDLLVPDFGEDHGNVHFMSPVVRERTRTREEIFDSLKIDPDMKLIVFSASGSGIGRFLLDALLRAFGAMDKKPSGVVLAVTGLERDGRRGEQEEEGVMYLGVQRDNQDLVGAADLVVSTAGKSTIDEALSYGSPLIAIPIKNHYEQERNAAALGFAHEDMGRLDGLVPRYLGRRTEPKNYEGAGMIASYLEGLAR
jgi:UDP-N-acetylglucosamine--N-acetylmuramyl-(pentapeptide) pyrophosphoryl-undecaprenol N-acetylglucosamine transferase